MSEECAEQLSWEEIEGAGKCVWRMCARLRDRNKRKERKCPRETGGRLVSPAPQCLDKLQQQGAEDSAETKQDAGSTQHFKENEGVQETPNLRVAVAKHSV